MDVSKIDIDGAARVGRAVQTETQQPIANSQRPRRAIQNQIRRLVAFGVLLTVFGTSGCGYYSFTGATIPSHLNTIAIPLVIDNSISGITDLDQRLTTLLQQRFVQQTRLALATDESTADAVLTVTIGRYANQPTAVGGVDSGEVAERNRVTISVSVQYEDRVRGDELLTRNDFSGFEDYDAGGDLTEETNAAQTALEIIADEIFTAATSNW